MSDLTIVYLTLNRLPQLWEKFHMGHLLAATHNHAMVVVSKEKMDLGRPNTQYLRQSEPPSNFNVYNQLLRGAKIADTKYIGVAEDDTLYTKQHFSNFRPPDDAVAYDISRWSVFSWDKQPMFSNIRRHVNSTMIGPRDLIIEALEERKEKYPDGNPYAGEIGRSTVENNMRVTRRNLVEWWCKFPIVTLCHPLGLSPTYHTGRSRKKRRRGELKAFDIPQWGTAKSIADVFNDGVIAESNAECELTVESVEELWANRSQLWQHNKPHRIRDMQNKLLEVIKNVAAGKTYDDARMKKSEWYQYIRSYYKAWRQEPLSPKAERELKIRFHDSIHLFHDIKENGIKYPLEAYMHEGKRYLLIGNRRLVIAYVLGIPTVEILTHPSSQHYVHTRSLIPSVWKGRGA